MFLNGKSNETEVFDQLTPHNLNKHLQSLLPKLTAKVFRTYNASQTMQNELAKWDPTNNEVMSVEEKVLFFNRASMQVALLCNHQRTLPKTFAAQMERIDGQISDTKKEIQELEEHLQILEEGKAPKIRKSENGEDLKPFSNNPDVVGRRITALNEKIKKCEIKKTEKDDLKEISTSTSKVNYIDPRISLVWCDKAGLDYTKVFPKALQQKFAWAIYEIKDRPDFVF